MGHFSKQPLLCKDSSLKTHVCAHVCMYFDRRKERQPNKTLFSFHPRVTFISHLSSDNYPSSGSNCNMWSTWDNIHWHMYWRTLIMTAVAMPGALRSTWVSPCGIRPVQTIWRIRFVCDAQSTSSVLISQITRRVFQCVPKLFINAGVGLLLLRGWQKALKGVWADVWRDVCDYQFLGVNSGERHHACYWGIEVCTL